MTRYPDFYSDFVGGSRVVVPVPEIGYNSDSEQYRSGYAHFKSFRLKTLALFTGFFGRWVELLPIFFWCYDYCSISYSLH